MCSASFDSPDVFISTQSGQIDVYLYSCCGHTPIHTCECLVFVFQGNLVNFLRTRGRLLLPAHQLLRFALWVFSPLSNSNVMS